MKLFGTLLLAAATLCFLIGGVMAYSAAASNRADSDAAALLRSDAAMLSSCEALAATDYLDGRSARSCAAEEVRYAKRLAQQADGAAAGLVWGSALAGAGVLFAILGTILFAAGKLEQVIRAGQAPTAGP